MLNCYLRKFNVFLLICVIFSFYGLSVSANAAAGKPSTITGTFTVAESTPIVVQNENLTFEIDKRAEKDADITADYTMYNPTKKTVTVNMLFPSLGKMEGSKVTVNGATTKAAVTNIEFQQLTGGEGDGTIMDISEIISLYNHYKEGIYQPQYFSPDDIVQVYTVSPNSEGKDTVKYPAGSTLFALDNNGFSQNGNTVQLDSRNLGSTYTIYLLKGKSLTFNNVSVKPSSEISMKQFALILKSKIFISDNSGTSNLSDQEYLNQIYRLFDMKIKRGSVIANNDLFIGDLQNLTILCYQVSFAPGATNDVKVSYNIAAGYPGGYSYDMNNSEYEYLLNPAKYWASFKSLKITVIPGPARSNIVYSTLPMTKNKDGSYSAVFKSLPKKDLTFCLGSGSDAGNISTAGNNSTVENISTTDNNIILIVGISVAAAGILILSSVIIRRKTNHRRST